MGSILSSEPSVPSNGLDDPEPGADSPASRRKRSRSESGPRHGRPRDSGLRTEDFRPRARGWAAFSLAVATAGFAACARGAPAPAEGASQTLTRFTLTKTDKGAAVWRISARRATLADLGGDAALEELRMELRHAGTSGAEGRQSAGVTRLTSRRGTYRRATGDVHLSGEVVVTAVEPGREATRLQTEALDYVSSKRQFQTELPVLITRGASRLRGRGLTADRDLHEIQILHEEAVLR